MSATLTPSSPPEVVEALRTTTGALRLVGGGSRQHRTPPAEDAARLELRGVAAIERIDAGDQTCTVQPGVSLAELGAAVASHGLELPCAGAGASTVGGLFAADPIGAVTAGGPQPRTLVLGLEGVLVDGTEFRSGARVTKSVAGFDLHRLFVGSAGRLFAVIRLHLRLKPRPRESFWFEEPAATPAEALARFQELRGLPAPPAALHLVHGQAGTRVVGRIAGRESFVQEMQRRHRLTPGPELATVQLQARGDTEVVAGVVRPSQTTQLLERAAASDAAGRSPEFILHGGGRFELALPDAHATDAMLAALPGLAAHACIVEGPAGRRGRGTPTDPGADRLTARLREALDPDGRLR